MVSPAFRKLGRADIGGEPTFANKGNVNSMRTHVGVQRINSPGLVDGPCIKGYAVELVDSLGCIGDMIMTSVLHLQATTGRRPLLRESLSVRSAFSWVWHRGAVLSLALVMSRVALLRFLPRNVGKRI